MDKEELKELFKKYHEGKCTEEEKALLEAWYLQHNEFTKPLSRNKIEAAKNLIFLRLPGNEHGFFRIGVKLAAAAVIIGILITVVVTFTQKNQKQHEQHEHTYATDIAPGKDKAFLIVASGQRIDLTDAANGHLLSKSGVTINKTRSGQVVFSFSRNGTADHSPNTIATPNGGQWQVQLADGTRIWLNAASSITFPTSFAGLTNRIISLQGEAYFEVAKDAAHPFLVISGNQRVEVLGTHFNINSYSDEPTIKTTLLQGRVKVSLLGVSTPAILKPGDQASVAASTIHVQPVDIDEALAWKNGYFRFSDENIQSIMRKLRRWYNIQVQYDPDVSTGGLNGKISRFKNISQVLAALEATKTVHFKVEGRRVTVMK
jgi:transmembrane sensor